VGSEHATTVRSARLETKRRTASAHRSEQVGAPVGGSLAQVPTFPGLIQRCASTDECGERMDRVVHRHGTHEGSPGPNSALRRAAGGRDVSQPSSPAEVEADRVARDFDRGGPMTVQARGEMTGVHRCGDIRADSCPCHDSPRIGEVLRSSGSPLDTATRQTMERRFGRDFGSVRVHTDDAATTSAAELGANAYTVGNHVVFGHGRFAPDQPDGRRLLAHELTHVVQQQRAPSAPAVVQRACGPTALGPPARDCSQSDAGVGGWQLQFKVNCDELLPGEEAKLSKLKAGSKLQIHGFASAEGLPAFNLDLSCHRANRVAGLVRASRPDCSVVGTFKHGASPTSGPGVVPDLNPPSFWRSVIIEEVRSVPEPQQPKGPCGPDATGWLIHQTVAAKKNAKVIAIRNKLDAAAVLAPRISGKAALNASDILEGAVVEKIADQRTKAGNPRLTAEANQQLGELSAVLGSAELTVAKMEALGLNVTAISTLTLLRDAALMWKALVGTNKPFDFKNDPSTMANPTSANCPDAGCRHTVTICPGSSGSNCFGQDFAGNIVYAHVGGFVGLSENALQLGSQWAQLQSTKSWDPPEDTRMISFGYNLVAPLDRPSFCAALQVAKGGLKTEPCQDCTEQTSAAIINP